MNKLKTTIILSLLALSAGSTGTPPSNIPITGTFDPDLRGHFLASTTLEIGGTYTFRNNTGDAIYVWLLNGGSRTITATVVQFDLYDVLTVKNVSLVKTVNNQGN